jgi:hypothetical protein
MENTFIKCKLCDYEGKRLDGRRGHLILKHHISTSFYKSLFPDAELVSNYTKNKIGATTRHNISLMSPEEKKKFGDGSRGIKRSDEFKKKNSESLKAKFKAGHKNWNSDGKTFVEFFGEERTKEINQRRAQHIANTRIERIRQGILNPRNHNHAISKCGFRKDLGHYVRSTWEANVARIFKFYNVKYEYEFKRFFFENFSYLPDFYIPNLNLFIEIKGYMDDKSRQMINEFKSVYSNENLLVVDLCLYSKIYAKHYLIIPGWEKEKDNNYLRDYTPDITTISNDKEIVQNLFRL